MPIEYTVVIYHKITICLNVKSQLPLHIKLNCYHCRDNLKIIKVSLGKTPSLLKIEMPQDSLLG